MPAKTTKQRDRLSQQLALAQYDNRYYEDDDDERTNTMGQQIGAARPEGSFTQEELNRMGGATAQPVSTQPLAGSLIASPANSVPQSTLPYKAPKPLVPIPSSSMMYAGTDGVTLAQELLTPPPAPPPPVVKPTLPSPEDKLLAVIANTNPTPRSLLKRLLIGAFKGASDVQVGRDTAGSAIGKILGGAGAQAVPFVDRQSVYQDNKRRALETYKVEAEKREQTQRQQKLDADIADANARLQESKNRRQELADERARQAASRLADDKRAEVTQLLNQLEKLPDNDPMRDILANKLRVEYKNPASRNYGLLDKSKDNKADITIYDEASGNYIRAKADGTPILRDGKPVVVRPGAANTKKTETQAQALKRIEQAEIAREGDIEQIAIRSVDTQGIINAMPQDLRDALNSGDASSFKAKQAREEYEKRYESALKKARADATSIRKQNIARAYEAEQGTKQSNNAPTSNKTVAPSNTQGTKPRVAATPRNAVGNRDFRNPRVIKLR